MSETVTNPTGSEESGSLSELDAAAMIEGLLPSMGEQEEVEAQTESDEETVSEPEQSDEDETDADEETSGDESQEPQSKTVRVKVDGEEIEVTLDELKSGYSRQSDYTKKTQEIAQARRVLEAEYQQVVGERQQYGQLLNQLAQQLQTQQQAEPDWAALEATDPIEYAVQSAKWQRNQQQQALIAQEQQRLAQLNAMEQQQHMAQTLERERGALLAAIPEWTKPEVAKAEKAMVIEQGKKLGFSEAELSQAYDHRAIVALRKAALYDALMSKRADVKPVQATQKTVSPGTKSVPVKTDAVKRATANVRRTGNVRDAAAAINLLI